MLCISVLGPVTAERDGRRLAVPGGRTAELLVRLAVEAGGSISADRLVEDVWAEDALTTRRNTLQSKVTKLRRAFEDPSVISSGDGGYALAVDPSEVDALAVLRDAAAAAVLLDAGEDLAAAELSAAALARYRGEVLPAAGDWAAPHRARLDEARVELMRIHFAARLQLGGGGDLVGELESAVAAYPYQEALWELLVTALYRAGRQADALASYQRVRAILADDLGLAPGPGLRDLERHILAQDQVLGRSASRAARAGNLPSLTAHLVGRQAEVAAVAELLACHRLVEILGSGGVGKTALAVATGRVLTDPGGVWLARLEAATTADEVLDAVVAALHVTGGEAALVERLRTGPAVLILDNCEHVLGAAAGLVARLLDGAPDLRILCTSQVRLEVEGEALFELAPLDVSDAAELFALRAVARRGDFSADAVHALCRSLDGLPLAIELAAARTKTLSVQEITRRLDDRFAVLLDPASRRPERRRALKATIRWSYDLLFPDDQRGLWALATFAGGGSLPAVEHVLAALGVPPSAGIDVVGRLASRSLILADEDRYRLLDSIRAFALDAMENDGSTGRALAAHAAWFADAARGSTAGVRGARQEEHLSFVRTERSNIDAALAWCATHEPLLALTIAIGFGWAWIVLGDSRGAQRIHTALEAAGPRAQPRERAAALLVAGWIEASADRIDAAQDHVAEARRLAEVMGDDELLARADYHLAYVVSHRGEFRRALELTARAGAMLDDLDRPWDQAANSLFAARAAISDGDRVRAVEACDQVEHWLRSVEDPWLHVRRDAVLGELARIEHRFDDAVAHIGQAAATSKRLGFRQTEAYQLSSLGRAQCQAGEHQAGAATLGLALEKAEDTGDVRLAALARVHLGRVLRALGQAGAARAALEAATAWHRSGGGGEQARLGECLLAALDAEDGATDAEPRLAAIRDAARLQGDAPVEVLALDALARIAVQRGDLDIAVRLADQADGRMEAASHFITDLDRTDARAVRPLERRAG